VCGGVATRAGLPELGLPADHTGLPIGPEEEQGRPGPIAAAVSRRVEGLPKLGKVSEATWL